MKSKSLINGENLMSAVLYLSAFLISLLAVYNDGSANDSQLQVSRIIQESGKIPEPGDCWQCYHPKLYHYLVAKIWECFNVFDWGPQSIIAQSINAIAGILTLLVCLKFIREQQLTARVKLIVFSLLAFNPRYIAISAQPTNDALVILFGTLVIYSLHRLIREPGVRYSCVLICFTVLAAVTKGSAFVILIGAAITLIILILSNRNFKLSFRKGYLGVLILMVVANVIIGGYFGEYFSNYRKYGKPVVYNTPMFDFPDFLNKETRVRPGIRSVAEGYFTFRLTDMLRTPVITNEPDIFPLHRTSLWSQLYGRTHFLYFDYWPKGIWQNRTPVMMTIGRVSLMLAMVPLIMFIMGLWICVRNTAANFLRRRGLQHEWIHLMIISGFTGFIILFTAIGRDFSFMKAIYLFPGILSFLLPLLIGTEAAVAHLEGKKILSNLFSLIMIILLIAYLIPVIDLILRLATR